MNDVMNLLGFLAKSIYKKTVIEFQGKKIDLNKFEKITVAEAFKKYAGIDEIFNHQIFFEQAKRRVIELKGWIILMFGHKFMELRLNRI